MSLKFKNLFYYFYVFFLVIYSSPIFSEQPIQFVETTGRAVINDEESINNARRNALEDAIFLAAIHGGAEVNGFSSVDKETNLSDHFTIRPAGKLLDYTILEEKIDGEHYKTTIRAAVGELKKPGCSKRSSVKITKFGAILNFSPKVPAWLRQVAEEIETDLGDLLRDHSTAILTDVSPIKLDIRKLVSIDDTYDYTSLTRGRVRVESGDFALIPSISMQLTKTKKNIESELFLSVKVNSTVYSGDSYSIADDSNYELILKLKSETPWRSFDILGKKTRDQIKLAVKRGLHEHVVELVDKVQCIPLTAKIKIKENRLVVDLGQSHGISTDSLAVSTGTNTPYSILHVTEVLDRQSIIEPLNKSLEISSLVGKTINFMESYQ